MPRSLFLLGLLTGLTLSLASLSTALFAASVREKRRIARARAAQGLGARRPRRRLAGTDSDGYGEESGSKSSEDEDEDEWQLIEVRKGEVVQGVQGAIGNTPLIRIASLSRLSGCEILGKAEFLNPGGSPKDRVALQILNDAERSGQLHPRTNSCVFEGTVGSTGISLAMLARAKGYRCSIVMPDDVAREKKEMLAALGAELKAVRPRAIADPAHFVNEARRLAQTFGGADGTLLAGPGARGRAEEEESDNGEGQAAAGSAVVVSSTATGGADEGADALSEKPRGFFADQFESESNFRAHYRGTGPEIWRQTGGMLDAFVCGAGTGGTLAGVSRFLKRKSRGAVHIVLADPQGSGLFNKVKHGVVYSHTEAEGTRRRHQTDTVVEGIGLNRLTHNFAHALPATDDAERVLDQEAVSMSRWLVQEDGLFLGSSSAVNLVAAVRVAQKLKRAQAERGEDKDAAPPTVVTLLCDSGARHLSRFWNDGALAQLDLQANADMEWLFPDGEPEVE